MVSLRYGTLPIVRETGGLKDSVCDCGDVKGNGFTFKTYNAHDMLDAIRRAEKAFENKQEWEVLVRRALSCKYCWQNSADEYIRLYKQLMGITETTVTAKQTI
jgi:starch synthase